MERARTVPEFIAWVTAKCEEFGATPEAKTYARSGALLPKRFYDEIFPLARFVQQEFEDRGDVLVQPNLGNGNFDAKVHIGSGSSSKVMFVELTYAKDGYDLSLRLEALEKEGNVALTGPITRVGRRGTLAREVKVRAEAIDHSVRVSEQLTRVEERLRAKSGKQYGKNHVLVVAVDDHILRDPDDRKSLDKRVQSLLSTLKLDFERVVFVGTGGNLFLSYPVTH